MANMQTDSQAEGQSDRGTVRQTVRQTEGQSDRQAVSLSGLGLCVGWDSCGCECRVDPGDTSYTSTDC